jgi:hypothetical protein
MDEQQQEQRPGDLEQQNAGNNAQADHRNEGDPARQQAELATGAGAAGTDDLAKQRQLTDEEVKARNKAAEQQQKAAGHVGLLGRVEHGVEHATGIEALQRHERRRQAFESAKRGPVGDAINDVNAFLNAMHDCDADTPEEMLANSDVQNAAVRARNGLKVFTGETPVTFSKPTSDAHLNVGSGGSVTGNTQANRDRAAAIREQHGDPVPQTTGDEDEEDAVPAGGVTKVPQPDAHVR